MAASEQLLGDVHEGLAILLKRKLENAIADVDLTYAPGGEGEAPVMPRTMSAAEMAIAVQLCKNSNITAAKSKKNALGQLDDLLNKRTTKPSEADLEAAMDSIQFSGQFS